MTRHLDIARAEIMEAKSDRLAPGRPLDDQELSALEKLTTALGLIREARALFAEADFAHPIKAPSDESTRTPPDRAVVLFLRRVIDCLLYTSPSPRDLSTSRMPSSA